MRKEKFNDLLDEYITGTISESTRVELFRLIEQPEYFQYLKERLGSDWKNGLYEDAENIALRDIIKSSVNEKIDLMEKVATPVLHRVYFLRKWGWVAAASVIFLIATTIFLVVSSDRPASFSKNNQAHPSEILPGKNGAVLTLADGSQILLDSVQNGIVAMQGGARAKVVDGTLLYEGGEEEGIYNIMSTPKGRQFHITLPDGTKVWLNSASSIRYPTVFAGSERRVDITGEAYFEVVKNRKMPFRLNINNKALVEVLGTQFNVSAYENEETINTTLIDGSVAVSSQAAVINGSSNSLKGVHTFVSINSDPPIILQPGQQAQMLVGKQIQSGEDPMRNKIEVVNNPDIEKAVAWKKGLFYFENATLIEVMRQLERWYDIDVVYEKGVPNIEFGGKMTKNISLSDLLIVLKTSKVHFRVEGRKLIVLP